MTILRALLIVVAVVAQTGCAAERRILTAHGADITVTVDDRTGWAVGAFMVEPPPEWTWDDWNGQSVQVRNLDDAVLHIAWWGSDCAETETVFVSGTQEALEIRVHNERTCINQGAKPRTLRLTLDRAIDASTVDASEVDVLPG